MNKFSCLPEFDKELKRLSKKYPSLINDIEDIKPVLLASPTGIGKNFTIINITKGVKIVKVRVQCESLRSRAIRLIYACHEEKIEFIFIELYFKGEKANEDKNRVSQYLKSVV